MRDPLRLPRLLALNCIGALATVTALFPTLQALGRLGSVAPAGGRCDRLLVVKLLRYRTTINDHAAGA